MGQNTLETIIFIIMQRQEEQPQKSSEPTEEKQVQLKKIQNILFKPVEEKSNHRKVEPDQITEQIYLGCYASSCNKEFLQKEGITRILMCLGHLEPPYPGQFNYKQIKIKDWESEDILKYFEEAYQFIQDGIFNQEKILVHCYAGASRSAAILAAYFIKRDKKNPQEAIDFIRQKREGVCPNSGFITQLWIYYSYIESMLPKPKPSQIDQRTEQQIREQEIQIKK